MILALVTRSPFGACTIRLVSQHVLVEEMKRHRPESMHAAIESTPLAFAKIYYAASHIEQIGSVDDLVRLIEADGCSEPVYMSRAFNELASVIDGEQYVNETIILCRKKVPAQTEEKGDENNAEAIPIPDPNSADELVRSNGAEDQGADGETPAT